MRRWGIVSSKNNNFVMSFSFISKVTFSYPVSSQTNHFLIIRPKTSDFVLSSKYEFPLPSISRCHRGPNLSCRPRGPNLSCRPRGPNIFPVGRGGGISCAGGRVVPREACRHGRPRFVKGVLGGRLKGMGAGGEHRTVGGGRGRTDGGACPDV